MSLADVTNLKIEAYSEHPEVYAFAEWLVDSYMATQQRARDKDEYLRTARKLIASLWIRDGDLFKFTTRAENFGRKRKQVWMSKKVLTLFKHLLSCEPRLVNLVAKGKSAKISEAGKGMNTVYCRTLNFKDRLSQLTASDILPNPDLPRVELNDADKNPLEIPAEVAAKQWFKDTEATLKNQYELLSEAKLCKADGSPVSPSQFYYVRVFKVEFNRGGRVYAGFETWPKEQRLGITFNGEPAVSIDISQLHPALIMRIYHSVGTEPIGMLRGDLKDAYDMPAYEYWPRAVHKKLINTLFNAKDEAAALRSIMTAHLQIKNGEYHCETYRGRSTRKGTKLFLDNKAGANKYLNYFKMMHPYYADAICSGIGVKLQRLDSDLVIKVVSICNELECPVLPVHDEFVFPEPWLPTMEIVLHRAFQTIYKDIGTIGVLGVKITRNNGSETPLMFNMAKKKRYMDS